MWTTKVSFREFQPPIDAAVPLRVLLLLSKSMQNVTLFEYAGKLIENASDSDILNCFVREIAEKCWYLRVLRLVQRRGYSEAVWTLPDAALQQLMAHFDASRLRAFLIARSKLLYVDLEKQLSFDMTIPGRMSLFFPEVYGHCENVIIRPYIMACGNAEFPPTPPRCLSGMF